MDYATAKTFYSTVARCPASNLQLFTAVNRAQSAASRQSKARVILADDGWVIVCTPKIAERLRNAGYQYA